MKLHGNFGNGKHTWEASEFAWQRGMTGSRLRTMLRSYLTMALPTDLADGESADKLHANRPTTFNSLMAGFAAGTSFVSGATSSRMWEPGRSASHIGLIGGPFTHATWEVPTLMPPKTAAQLLEEQRDRDQDNWPEGGLWR